MADESPEAVMDAELATLLGTNESKPAAPAAAADEGKPAVGEKSPPVASPEGTETPTGEADPLLAALEAIEEEKPEVKDGKPELSADQKTVLDAIPDAQTLKNIEGTLQGYNNFTTLLATGKFDGVEAELQHWNPDVLDGWKDYIYEKHKVEFVDRFIAESEGKGKSKDLTKLEREVAQLKSSLQDKANANTQSEAQNKLNASFEAYNNHIVELFKQFPCPEADREYIVAVLNQKLAKDPKVLADIKSGKPKAINPVFKEVSRAYLKRDKQTTDATAAKLADQEKKKIPLGGGASETVGDIPDDIKQVKKGQEDGWMDQQLGKLFGKKK